MHLNFSFKRTYNCSGILFPTLLSLSQYKLKQFYMHAFFPAVYQILIWLGDSKGSAFSLGPSHSPGLITREYIWIMGTREFQLGREQHPGRNKCLLAPKTVLRCRKLTSYKGSSLTYLLMCCKCSSFSFLIATMLEEKFVFAK